jgi:PAS domain S-box-containing protein
MQPGDDPPEGGDATAWLAAVVQSSQDAIVGTDLDGVIISWNAGAERIFGYSAAEVIGHDAGMLRPPDIEAEASRLTARVARGERIEHRVVRVRKDGSRVTLASVSTPIRNAAGEVIGIATVARDLAAQERADALFRSLVETAPDAMVCVDEQGVIALVNAQAEWLFGYARDELIGRPVETLVPADLRTAHAAHRRDYVADPHTRPMGVGLELAAVRKDGRMLPVEISLSAVQTEDGLLVTAAIRDATEQRHAAIVSASGDAIVSHALDGTVTAWNAGAERLYGFSAAEMIGRVAPRLVPPDRVHDVDPAIERVRGGQPSAEVETQVVRKDGTRIDISATLSPLRDESGAVIGTSSIARDITEAKRVRDALRVSEARKSAMLEAALDGVITIDHTGAIVEFNTAAERQFGYDRDEAVGRPMAELIIPPALREAHRAGLSQCLATGEGPLLGVRVEMPAMRADGTEFPVELAISRVEVPGAPLFTAHLRDLTEQNKAEAEQRELARRLAEYERLESLGRLAGGVAHDFNNLLGLIQIYASIAERRADDPQLAAAIEHIRDAADQGARLTRQLLIVGRREPTQPELVQINSVIANLGDLLTGSIGASIRIDRRLDPDLPEVHADRVRLEQMLINLTLNARDAMPDGGTLTIGTATTRVEEADARLPPGLTPGQYIELTVADTGIGMSDEVRQHIFEAFFTTKPADRGTGLGLATVHSIVDEAGGSIEVESSPGRGSSFRILLPAAERGAEHNDPATTN